MLVKIQVTAPTNEQKESIKKELKEAGINFSMRVHKNIKRVYGSIDVRPTKKVDYRWNGEETLRVIEIVRNNGVTVDDYTHDGRNNNDLVYAGGLNYLMCEKVIS